MLTFWFIRTVDTRLHSFVLLFHSSKGSFLFPSFVLSIESFFSLCLISAKISVYPALHLDRLFFNLLYFFLLQFLFLIQTLATFGVVLSRNTSVLFCLIMIELVILHRIIVLGFLHFRIDDDLILYLLLSDFLIVVITRVSSRSFLQFFFSLIDSRTDCLTTLLQILVTLIRVTIVINIVVLLTYGVKCLWHEYICHGTESDNIRVLLNKVIRHFFLIQFCICFYL